MARASTAEVKAEIQSRGVRRGGGVAAAGCGRRGGAGPAEGFTLVLNGSPTSVPGASSFVADSPFRLEHDEGGWVLLHGGDPVPLPVGLPSAPAFYGRRTDRGVPFRKIALLHGTDCLASTVLQACAYWDGPEGCAFCGIGLSLRSGRTVAAKEPAELAAVAVAARHEGARHVTLTAGSTPDRRPEWERYRVCARAIRQSSGLPVHVQLTPPVSPRRLEKLREAGVDSVGIHLESFDPAVLARVAPFKARLSRASYVRAWGDAVRVFGRNQVSSFLLMGLGESPRSLLDGCEALASLGVYPYLVPFRPIPGTPMADHRPPAPERVKETYAAAARILHAHGLDWRAMRAGCVRCRGCSALPEYQDALSGADRGVEDGEELTWERLEAGADLARCHAIRHTVFVREQGLFRATDRDELEATSVHLLVRRGAEPLGTVRLTPLGGAVWLGSRLAVLAPHRGAIGARIVRRAEEEVLRHGCRQFIAHIQLSRVGFFERCGWRVLRSVPAYHGKPHMLMEAAGPLWEGSRHRSPAPATPAGEDAARTPA